MAVAGSLALPACGGGGSSATAPTQSSSVGVTVTGAQVFTPNGTVKELPAPVRDQVTATVKGYFDKAPQQPHPSPGGSGAPPATGVEPFFTAAAAGRLGGPDRAALVDEGFPGPIDAVRTRKENVALGALGDDAGRFEVVTATFEVAQDVVAKATTFTIDRSGDLVLVPDGGTWKIAAYHIRVTRQGGGKTTTSKAALG